MDQIKSEIVTSQYVMKFEQDDDCDLENPTETIIPDGVKQEQENGELICKHEAEECCIQCIKKEMQDTFEIKDENIDVPSILEFVSCGTNINNINPVEETSFEMFECKNAAGFQSNVTTPKNCTLSVEAKKVLKRDALQKHIEPEEIDSYKCAKCDYTTKRKSSLNIHMQGKHTKATGFGRYTEEEKGKMVMWYKNNSLEVVRDMFSVNFPDRPIPCAKTILNVFNKFKAKGCVSSSHNKRNATNYVLSEELKLNILCYVEERPDASLSDIARHFDISRSSVYRTLKQFNYKPYKMSKRQELSVLDLEIRTNFCETMSNVLNDNCEILNKIVFTDEATFTLNGEVNSENFGQNLTNTHHPKKVNAWIGILEDRLIGPFFIDGNLNGNKFLDLLKNRIVPSIDLQEIEEPWIQMDGAPPHGTIQVRNFLNTTFPGRWISRYGTIPWPPRSPDLSPHDFFLWGYLKNKIYDYTVINNLDELKDRIQIACDEINPDIIRNTLSCFRNRLAFCLERQGGHFENLMGH